MTRLRTWLPSLLYTLFILASLPYMPRLFYYFDSRFGRPTISVSTNIFFLAIAAAFFSYLLFGKRERRWQVYLWAVALTMGYVYPVLTLRVPAEKVHFLEYGLLACLVTSALRKEGMRRAIIYLWGFIIAYHIGLLDEACQWFLPNRIGEVRDVLLNGLSVAMGQLVVMLVLRPDGITWELRWRDIKAASPWMGLAAGLTWVYYMAQGGW